MSAADVREFLDDMLRDSTRAMAKKCLTSLRSIIRAAQERGLVQHNVARGVKLRRSERHDPDRVFPTKDEIRALIANAPPRHQPLIMTALFTGTRMSELRGLSWDAIDFDRSIITVRKRADRYCDMGNTKRKSGRREIPMGPQLAKVLKEWKLECPSGDIDLVFPNGVGNVETHSNIYNRIFKPLMLVCGIVDRGGRSEVFTAWSSPTIEQSARRQSRSALARGARQLDILGEVVSTASLPIAVSGP